MSMLKVIMPLVFIAFTQNVQANEHALVVAATELVASGYFYELAAEGECNRYGSKQHFHKDDIAEVIIHLNPQQALIIGTIFHSKEMVGMKKHLEELQLDLVKGLQTQVAFSKDFICGLRLGYGTTHYVNARRKWSALTGAPVVSKSK
jgi:hypothetical protein